MPKYESTITTGIEGLRAAVQKAVKSENHEDGQGAALEAFDLAISLVAVFLQNQERIATALEEIANRIDR